MMDSVMVYVTLAVIFALSLAAAFLLGRSRLCEGTSNDSVETTKGDGPEVEVFRPNAEPLRVRYTLESKNGTKMRSGVCTFFSFTYGDFFRDSCQRAIRAAIESENPGWWVVGYVALTEANEEVMP